MVFVGFRIRVSVSPNDVLIKTYVYIHTHTHVIVYVLQARKLVFENVIIIIINTRVPTGRRITNERGYIRFLIRIVR